MPEIQIRSAKIDDAPGIADVAVESWKWGYQGVLPDKVIQFHSNKSEREEKVRSNWKPERAYFVAVTERHRVLGFVLESKPSFPQFDAEIAGLYVHPEAVRQGVGRRLVAAIAQEFIKRGHKSVCLLTLRDNAIGRGFYEKIGGKYFKDEMWHEFPAIWYQWEDISPLCLPD